MSDPTTYTPEQIREALELGETVLELYRQSAHGASAEDPNWLRDCNETWMSAKALLALAQMAARMLEEGPQAYKWYGPRSLSDMEAVEHITKEHPKSDRALHFVSKHVRPLYAIPAPEAE